jgi:predicted RND superfamily exporter protein
MIRPTPVPGTSTPDERSGSLLFALSMATILAAAAIAPWIVRAAMQILAVDSTTPIEWVPDTYAPRRAYETFTTDFESGDVVVASWPGCTLDAPAIERFTAAATGPDAPRDRSGRTWFETVISGGQVLARLTDPPLSLDPAAAVQRLQGILVGPDGRTTCLVIPFTREGLADRRRAVVWLREKLTTVAGAALEELHLAGPVIDNVSVDEASAGTLGTYGGPAALVILVLTWWSLRSLRYALLVFLVSMFCVGLCFLSLWAWGDRMNPVLIVMPLLVLTLGVSGGIHLVNYLVEAARSGPPQTVAARAIRLGWLPCSLSAGTTALGLASLVVSELEPIRVFGFHAAAGVTVTLLVLFLVVPGLFQRWPIGAAAHAETSADAPAISAGIVRRAGPIVVTSAAAMLVAALGVPGIRTSVAIDTLFTPESRVIGDYRWLEREIGPLAPVEVVLRFGGSSEIRPAERLAMASEVADILAGIPAVTGVVSAATFLPELGDHSGTRTAARKAIAARKLEQNLAKLNELSVVRDVAGEQLWRVTARTSALSGIDYGELLDTVRDRVQPVVAAHGGAARGVRADCTGVMPLINAIQNTLLHDLFSSFLSACAVITVIMMLVERGVLAGLVAMVPNVFPMVLLFGLLGWTRTALDIGSVMTASIALGMAVDGTFHFLTFFRRGLTGGRALPPGADCRRRIAAVHEAYRHSAGALTQSAVVCGLGILVFVASSFAPSRRFAGMLSLLVGAALVGDLVLLPALLTGPLGRYFKPLRPRG